MKPLIDCDVLLYEIGIQGQYIDDEGELQVRPFSYVADLFDDKIAEICAEVYATEPPLLFMSYNKLMYNLDERQKEREREKIKKRAKRAREAGNEELVKELKKDFDENKAAKYNPNFREGVAEKKEYKGNRKNNEKPKHFLNLVEYARNNYECVIAKGLEADDMLGVYQTAAEPLTTIICSRDKDLKIIEGMHYGWEVGNQASFGPERVTKLGYLKLSSNKKKLTGVGLKFFYSQVLTGDVTDNYGGLPKCGPVKAYSILDECNTEEEMFNAVLNAYTQHYGDTARKEMLEQARLAWMINELDEDGNPVHWEMYDERIYELA